MARRLILPLLGDELMFTAHRYLPALLLSAGVLLAAPACASYGYGYQRGGVRALWVDTLTFRNGRPAISP